MKLLSSLSVSSSSSNSSSTSVAFDTSMSSSKSGPASCLTGILGRILCSHSLPAHPSHDHITYTTTSLPSDFRPNDTTTTPPPGIVARLRGLDYFPNSLNSVECKNEKLQAQSFLEIPTFLELENEDFFLLSFESTSKRNKKSRAKRKSKQCHKQDEEIVKKIVNEKKLKLTRKNNKIQEHEDRSSEDSSPVSVLDFDQFLIDLQAPVSEESSIRRRKLWSRLEDYKPLSRSRHVDDNYMGDDENSKTVEEKCQRLIRNKFWHSQYYINVFTMAQTQVFESNWKFHDQLDDISAYFGFQILDQLLEELFDQFSSRNQKF